MARLQTILLILGLVVAQACKPPPDAPTQLDDLCTYLFSHHSDEDSANMEAGVNNLITWLDKNLEMTLEGYSVSGLDSTTTGALDGQERSVLGIFGVAVGTESAFPLADAVYAMVAVDQEEIHGDYYSDYQRDYLSDPACFLAQSCPRLEATEEYEAHFTLGITSRNYTHNQYLWVDTYGGLAMAHRAWLVEPPEVDFYWLQVEQQYYLDVFVPAAGGHRRLQVTWMVNNQDAVPQDLVMNLVIDGMIDHSDNMEDWFNSL